MTDFLIWKHYIVMVLFPFSHSFPQWLSFLTSRFATAVLCASPSPSPWQPEADKAIQPSTTDKLAATQLWLGGNNLKRDRIASTVFCSGKQHLTHHAADFLFDLISWCFVTGVGTVCWIWWAAKQLERGQKETQPMKSSWDGDGPGVAHKIAQLRWWESLTVEVSRGKTLWGWAGRAPSAAYREIKEASSLFIRRLCAGAAVNPSRSLSAFSSGSGAQTAAPRLMQTTKKK